MKRTIKLTESDLTRIVKRILNETKFHNLYDTSKGSTYFKFKNLNVWNTLNDQIIKDPHINKILDSITPTEIYHSYDEWKESKWYYKSNFPFSAGNHNQQEDVFNLYLSRYGDFIVVDLSSKTKKNIIGLNESKKKS